MTDNTDLIAEAQAEAAHLRTSDARRQASLLTRLADALAARDAEIQRLRKVVEGRNEMIGQLLYHCPEAIERTGWSSREAWEASWDAAIAAKGPR